MPISAFQEQEMQNHKHGYELSIAVQTRRTPLAEAHCKQGSGQESKLFTTLLNKERTSKPLQIGGREKTKGQELEIGSVCVDSNEQAMKNKSLSLSVSYSTPPQKHPPMSEEGNRSEGR